MFKEANRDTILPNVYSLLCNADLIIHSFIKPGVCVCTVGVTSAVNSLSACSECWCFWRSRGAEGVSNGGRRRRRRRGEMTARGGLQQPAVGEQLNHPLLLHQVILSLHQRKTTTQDNTSVRHFILFSTFPFCFVSSQWGNLRGEQEEIDSRWEKMFFCFFIKACAFSLLGFLLFNLPVCTYLCNIWVKLPVAVYLKAAYRWGYIRQGCLATQRQTGYS